MSDVFTQESAEKLKIYLESHYIPAGLGTAEKACSIAAINIAINGYLTDRVPECMSLVIGEWIISVQDAMPDEIRNSDNWKDLLPAAAGTGRDLKKETARVQILVEWFYTAVLPSFTHLAEQDGLDKAWNAIIQNRSLDKASPIEEKYEDEEIGEDFLILWEHTSEAVPFIYDFERGFFQGLRWSVKIGDVVLYGRDQIKDWNLINPCEILQKLIEV